VKFGRMLLVHLEDKSTHKKKILEFLNSPLRIEIDLNFF
jgi:hypothetical protein